MEDNNEIGSYTNFIYDENGNEYIIILTPLSEAEKLKEPAKSHLLDAYDELKKVDDFAKNNQDKYRAFRKLYLQQNIFLLLISLIIYAWGSYETISILLSSNFSLF